MFEIVNRYTHALLYKSETATNVKAAIIEAVKEGADLRDACLEGADLRDADLRGAKGLLSKGTNPLHIGGSRHWIIVREDGYVTVGCIHRPLVWWESEYARVGKVEGYNETAIAEYKRHIAHCRAWMELHGVVEVIVKADASETV